jgi:hypothetical protein
LQNISPRGLGRKVNGRHRNQSRAAYRTVKMILPRRNFLRFLAEALDVLGALLERFDVSALALR